MNYHYLLFNFGKKCPIKNDLTNILNDSKSPEVFVTSAPMDTISYLSDNDEVIFLFNIESNEDYALIHTILNKFKAKIFSKLIVPICITDNRDLRELLKLRVNNCEFIYSPDYSPHRIKEEIDQLLLLNKTRSCKNRNLNISKSLNVLLRSRDNTIGSSLELDCFSHNEVVVVSDIIPTVGFGTPLDLGIEFRYDNIIANVFLSGKLKSIESLDSSTHFLHLDITKFDLKKIDEFYRLYEKRQQEIFNFLALTKGLG